MRHLFVILSTLLLAVPVEAAETPWQSLAPGVRMRLIATEVPGPDGTTLAALELDMPATTKTYWRVPGETGLPTEIDFSGSAGVAGGDIVWPYPTRETRNGYTDLVFYGPTVLPIELRVDSTLPVVRAAAVLGICSDICIPAQADFTLPLDLDAPDPAQRLRIEQALAQTPLPWPHAEAAIGDVAIASGGDHLAVPIDDARIDPLSIIADAGSTDLPFGAPQKSRDGKLVLLPLLGDSAAGELVGRTIKLTFMTSDGPFEMSRRILPSTPDGF